MSLRFEWVFLLEELEKQPQRTVRARGVRRRGNRETVSSCSFLLRLHKPYCALPGFLNVFILLLTTSWSALSTLRYATGHADRENRSDDSIGT